MIGHLLAAFGCGLLVGAVGAASGVFAFSVMVYRRALG
jgi:hypothetical protein